MAKLILLSLRFAAIVAVLLAQAPCHGAEPPSEDAETRDRWSKYYAEQLPRYRFLLESDKGTPLDVDSKAVLKWENSVRVGHTHGDVFVWTYHGRAAIVGTIFSYDTPGELSPTGRVVAHGFQSLSPDAVVGERDGAPLPTIRGPGIEFHVMEDAPAPARTRPLRIAQMRQLAKQFSASTRENTVVEPLRLLPQPMYRYQTKESELDGAVFAFVSGTDPELILVIEARPAATGSRWHFGAGRYTNVPLQFKNGDRVIWDFDERASRDGGYFSQHGIDTQPLEPAVSDESPEPTPAVPGK